MEECYVSILDFEGLDERPLTKLEIFDSFRQSVIARHSISKFTLTEISVLFLSTDRETEYMAFGLSGSDTQFAMVGADVVVADFLSGGEPRAVDYYLSAYAQVRL